MLDFDTYMMRYGEFGLQAVIEHIERLEGISVCTQSSLEDRWALLMSAGDAEPRRQAA